MNLAKLADEAVQRLGERMTLDFQGEQFTNVQMLDWARRLQRTFSRLGLRRGDVAAMYLFNHPLVYPVFGGIFRTGATALPVMFLLTPPELRYVLADSRAKGVITDGMGIDKVREAIEGLDHIEWILVRGGEDAMEASPPEYRLETLLEDDPERTLSDIDEDDVALMLYTAGTTGKPKGVMLTHSNLYASADAVSNADEMDRYDSPRIAMSAMPMSHIFGVGVMIRGHLTPARLADSYGVQMGWFEPERFMQLIQEHRCNAMVAVPTMLILILNHDKVDEYDLSSLTEVVCGAAPLPVEIAKAFMERYGCRIREIYGQTESAGLGSANRFSEPYVPGSAGRAYYNTELRIFDGNDNSLPPGQRGEIVLRGPSIMKGYYNRPEATAEALRNGWLHTGDIGYLDQRDHLFIVDRKKDLIVRGGENVFPAELEDILFKHASIAEAAVVGAPDDVYGEKVIAYVVTKPGEEISEQEVINFFKDRTSSFKAPERVFFIDALPKSPVGKVLRRKLRDRAAEEI